MRVSDVDSGRTLRLISNAFHAPLWTGKHQVSPQWTGCLVARWVYISEFDLYMPWSEP